MAYNIGDYAINNHGGQWSDQWYTKNGKRISCPQCGCPTVSPVGTEEVINQVHDNLTGMDDDDRQRWNNDILKGALGPNPEFVKEINDLDDNEELEAFHRKHGFFTCGNQPCVEEGYSFFSPHDDIQQRQPEDKKVWDSEVKKRMGYGNAWDTVFDKQHRDKKDFW